MLRDWWKIRDQRVVAAVILNGILLLITYWPYLESEGHVFRDEPNSQSENVQKKSLAACCISGGSTCRIYTTPSGSPLQPGHSSLAISEISLEEWGVSKQKSEGPPSPLHKWQVAAAWRRAPHLLYWPIPSHQLWTLLPGSRLISEENLISKRSYRKRNKLVLSPQFPEGATHLVSSRTPSIPENKLLSARGLRRLLKFCKWREVMGRVSLVSN